MSLAVANQYAQALADVTLEPGSGLEPALAADQLRAFEELLAQSAELRNTLLSPAVSESEKRAVIGRLRQSLGLSTVVGNFLAVVAGHRRIGLLRSIRQALEGLLDARLGLARAEVKSHAPLRDEDRERLAGELSRLTGKAVRCECGIDASLLGGAVVQIGSTVYDGSVRGKLEALRGRLME
jgi:F-type H+-transporting ATPase subunit delta